VRPDSVVQFENPDAKTWEFKPADRSNLSIFAELGQLAMITKTPRHYFPQDTGLSNISADTIRADEGALMSQVSGYHATLGDGWEEVARLLGQTLHDAVDLSPSAQVVWLDRESRSLAERADAAVKVKDVFPWQVVAERALGAGQDEIARWEAMRSSEGLGALVAAAQAPTPMPGVPVANGAG
jgi:hypothetical protein